MAQILPDGVTVIRPDSCYLFLLDIGVPRSLADGVKFVAVGAPCASYVSQKALALADSGIDVLGAREETEENALVRELVERQIGAADDQRAVSSTALFDGVIWSLILDFVKAKLRDPSLLDYAAELLAKAL